MSIPGLSEWLETPPGRYLLEWEQKRLEAVVADIFGYNAVQLGLPGQDVLSANRMPFRFRCASRGDVAVVASHEDLPFASASLDLVVLPHVLEFSARPHQVLREVERVLVPEGSVVISGFNPYSLWGVRRLAARKDAYIHYHGMDAGLELGGRRIFIVHYPHYARAMAATGKWDLVCCGHSHKTALERLPNLKGGTTPLVNPGTVGGVGNAPATYVMADLETMEFEMREIDKAIEWLVQAG